MTPSGTFKQPKKPDPVVLWWKGLSRETRAAVLTTAGCLAGIAAILIIFWIVFPEKNLVKVVGILSNALLILAMLLSFRAEEKLKKKD